MDKQENPMAETLVMATDV